MLLRMAAPPGGINALPLQLNVGYTDRAGQRFNSARTVALPAEALGGGGGGGAFYESSGVRKAVLLSRYTDLVRNWLIDEWRMLNVTGNRTVVVPGALCAVFPSEFCPPVPAAATYDVRQTAALGGAQRVHSPYPGTCGRGAQPVGAPVQEFDRPRQPQRQGGVQGVSALYGERDRRAGGR